MLLPISCTVPPNITTILTEAVTFPNTPTAHLLCAGIGNQPPVFTWLSNGNTPIVCGERDPVIIEDIPPPYTDLHDRCINDPAPGISELVIYNPRVEDEGTYTCMAQNSVGTSTASTFLQVDGT